MRLAKGMALAAALAMVSASSAMAGFTVTPGGTQNSNANVASGAATAGALNSTFTYNHAGPDFVPGIVVIEGDLTDGGASGNWANDARIEICNPTVCVVTGGLTATQGYTGTIHVGPVNINSNGLLTGTSIGTWTFETFDAFNEGGTTIDNIWSNLSINIQDALPPDTNQNVNLGALVNDDSTLKVNGDFTSNGIHDFYTFTISESVDADALSWLNIRTTGMDTELGLYDSLGNFIATDDDGNGGYPPGHSMLSFGGANDPHINTPTTSGEDGVLAAGTYTVVVGGYNTVFGATLNDITGGTAQGNYSLSINYAPEPATLTLLAFGAIGLIRRRR